MPVIYLFSQKLRLNTECGTFPDKWEAATVSFNTYEFSDTEHEWAIRVGSPVIGQRVDNKLYKGQALRIDHPHLTDETKYFIMNWL